MKKQLTGALGLAMAALTACTAYNDTPREYEENMKVYFVPARYGMETVNLYGVKDTVFTFAGARYGGTTVPVGEITAAVSLGGDELVTAYNEAHGTAYEPMPEGVASLVKESINIPATGFASEGFEVRINDQELLTNKHSYLVPLQMTSVGGPLRVNEDYTTAYLIVNRRSDTGKLAADLTEHLRGQWTFDDANDPWKATVGADIVPGSGNAASGISYDYSDCAPIAGPGASNRAVTCPFGSFLRADHNIGANGGGGRVNEYTVVIDFRLDAANYATWVAMMQTDLTNSNETDIWAVGKWFGFYQDSYYGDPVDFYWGEDSDVTADTWHRLVVTVSLSENTSTMYMDGKPLFTCTDEAALAVDGFLSLDPVSVLIAADGTDYDNQIDIAEVRFYDWPMTEEHADYLGTVR